MPDSPRPLAPDECLLRLVLHASSAGRSLRRLLAAEAATLDLSDAELLIVWLCDDASGQGLAQIELATAVGVSPAQMCATVQRLRQRGLIKVQRNALDRRRQVWRTTTTGSHLLNVLRPALGWLASRLDIQIPPADQQLATDLFERLAERLAELEATVTAPRASQVRDAA